MHRGNPTSGRLEGVTLNTFALLNEEDSWKNEEADRERKLEQLRKENEAMKDMDWSLMKDESEEIIASEAEEISEPEEPIVVMDIKDETIKKTTPSSKKVPRKKITSHKQDADEISKKKEIRSKVASALKKPAKDETTEKKKKTKSEKKEARKQFER